MNRKYICPICGYNELKNPPWGEDGKNPSYDICACCGCEFGYEDVTEESKKRFREKWINNGAKWFTSKKKPKDWNLEEQLKNL